jgi:hypothetical protein
MAPLYERVGCVTLPKRRFPARADPEMDAVIGGEYLVHDGKVGMVITRAGNSRGPGGPTGPLGTPVEGPRTLPKTCRRKRARTSARCFGSTVRPAAAH